MCEDYIRACEEHWDKYDKYDIIDYQLIVDSETDEVIDEVPIFDDGSEFSEWWKKEILHMDNKNEDKH